MSGQRNLNFLALDGGGVRGLSSLLLLQNLMKRLNPDSPPKPCEIFDMIGGTSTGGLIAIMLGRLQMDIESCIAAYRQLSDVVFRKVAHRISIKGMGVTQGRFDARALENAIKEIISLAKLDPNVRLMEETNPRCKVFVCATRAENRDITRLRSYYSIRDSNPEVTIWEAGRATSAATTFFDPIEIGEYKERFMDGATGANNPVREVWTEAKDMWPNGLLDQNLNCMVSIGTGKQSLNAFGSFPHEIVRSLTDIAVETEHTAENFLREHRDLASAHRYYRFNVDQGLEDIGLEESARMAQMVAATRRYTEQQTVLDAISGCAQTILTREPKTPQPKFLSTVPFIRDAKFVDRESIMNDLASGFTSNQRMALVGLAGAGKSQSTIEYSYRLQERSPFTYIFWIYAGDRQRFEQSYAGLAQCLKLPGADDPKIDSMWLVKIWLADRDNGNWFMILDNVDDETVFSSSPSIEDKEPLATYLPQTQHGLILVTSRNRQAALDLVGDVDSLVSVPEMSQTEAVSLLRCRLAKNRAYEGALELVEALSRMPLAITQAASYINVTATWMTVPRYLDLFRKNQIKYLEEDAPDLRRDLTRSASNSAIGTWRISFDHIRNYSLTACETLCFVSLLHWQRIPLEYLFADMQDDVELEDRIRPLLAFSLIEEDASGKTFSVHELVSLAMRSWMRHNEELKKWQDTSMELISLRFPTIAEECFEIGEVLLPHADTVLQYNPSDPKAIIARSRLLSDTGQYLGLRGNYQEAIRRVEDARAIQIQHLNDDVQNSPSIIRTIRSLISLYIETGRYRDAENLSRASLKRVESVLGSQHMATLDLVYCLAGSMLANGGYGEAEMLARRAYRDQMAAFGANDDTTLKSLYLIATILQFQGKYQPAELIFRELLEKKTAASGPKSLSTLETAQKLAQVLHQLERFGDAEPMQRYIWEQRSKIIGEDHPWTLRSLSAWAITLQRLGDIERAYCLNQQFLHGLQNKLRPDHPLIIEAQENEASILGDQGEVQKACARYQEVVQLKERVLGQTHPGTLVSRGNLGRMYLKLGRYAAAETLLSQVLKDLDGVHGTLHPHRIIVATNLTEVLFRQSNIDRAETLACTNLENAEKGLGNPHKLTIVCQMNLAAVREAQHRYHEAESLTRVYLKQIQEIDGLDSAAAQRAMSDLADILDKQTRQEEAIQLRSQLVETS